MYEFLRTRVLFYVVLAQRAQVTRNARTRTCQVHVPEVMETDGVTELEGDVAEANGEAEEEQSEAMLQATPAQDFCLESITCSSSY